MGWSVRATKIGPLFCTVSPLKWDLTHIVHPSRDVAAGPAGCLARPCPPTPGYAGAPSPPSSPSTGQLSKVNWPTLNCQLVSCQLPTGQSNCQLAKSHRQLANSQLSTGQLLKVNWPALKSQLANWRTTDWQGALSTGQSSAMPNTYPPTGESTSAPGRPLEPTLPAYPMPRHPPRCIDRSWRCKRRRRCHPRRRGTSNTGVYIYIYIPRHHCPRTTADDSTASEYPNIYPGAPGSPVPPKPAANGQDDARSTGESIVNWQDARSTGESSAMPNTPPPTGESSATNARRQRARPGSSGAGVTGSVPRSLYARAPLPPAKARPPTGESPSSAPNLLSPTRESPATPNALRRRPPTGHRPPPPPRRAPGSAARSRRRPRPPAPPTRPHVPPLCPSRAPPSPTPTRLAPCAPPPSAPAPCCPEGKGGPPCLAGTVAGGALADPDRSPSTSHRPSGHRRVGILRANVPWSKSGFGGRVLLWGDPCAPPKLGHFFVPYLPEMGPYAHRASVPRRGRRACGLPRAPLPPDSGVRWRPQPPSPPPIANWPTPNCQLANPSSSTGQFPIVNWPAPKSQLANSQLPTGQLPTGQPINRQLVNCQVAKSQPSTGQLNWPTGQIPTADWPTSNGQLSTGQPSTGQIGTSPTGQPIVNSPSTGVVP